MKTTTEVITILYLHLKNSVLMTDLQRPNGNLGKFKRPENSIKEDVVIADIGGITNEPVQRGILIVNIFVPNLNPDYFPNLNGDRSQPDTARLDYLSKLLRDSIVGEVWDNEGEYCFEIQQGGIDEDTNNQHYAWFRVKFYSINI